MARTIIISDVHGNVDALLAVLKEVDPTSDDFVIFLGDVIDGGRHSDNLGDEACAALACEAGDRIIVGNHEAPFLWPHLKSSLGFGGMRPWDYGYLCQVVARMKNTGKLRLFEPTASGHLVSHAGINGRHSEALPLNKGFVDADLEYLPAWLGEVGESRGGAPGNVGGILWQDGSTFLADDTSPYRQICGHTPQTSGYAKSGDGRRIVLDGGKEKGCVALSLVHGKAEKTIHYPNGETVSI